MICLAFGLTRIRSFEDYFLFVSRCLKQIQSRLIFLGTVD